LNKRSRHLEIREIKESIKEEFYSIFDLDMDVKAIMYNSITFICVKEKEKRKKRIQRTVPTFFALFLGHKYFFCSRKDVPLYYIKVIAISLGYDDGKRIKLIGRDLRSLIKLLWIKQQGTIHAEDINRPPVYQLSNPIVR